MTPVVTVLKHLFEEKLYITFTYFTKTILTSVALKWLENILHVLNAFVDFDLYNYIN